jgi:hypothetical protein
MKRNDNYEITSVNWNYGEDHPIAEIQTVSENGDIRYFYLMPFRKYRFQVCDTSKGEGDMGASEVLHYEQFKDMPYFVTTAILTDACRAALTQFIKPHGWGNISGRIDCSSQSFYAFIDKCHRFIYGTKSNYIIYESIKEKEDAKEKEKRLPDPTTSTEETTPFIEYWKGELAKYKGGEQ